jgi:hypothetical protein
LEPFLCYGQIGYLKMEDKYTNRKEYMRRFRNELLGGIAMPNTSRVGLFMEESTEKEDERYRVESYNNRVLLGAAMQDVGMVRGKVRGHMMAFPETPDLRIPEGADILEKSTIILEQSRMRSERDKQINMQINSTLSAHLRNNIPEANETTEEAVANLAGSDRLYEFGDVRESLAKSHEAMYNDPEYKKIVALRKRRYIATEDSITEKQIGDVNANLAEIVESVEGTAVAGPQL